MSGLHTRFDTRRYAILCTVFLVTCFLALLPNHTAFAASEGKDHMARAERYIEQSLQMAEKGNMKQAQQTYDQFTSAWHAMEDGVKSDSKVAYQDIEAGMGQVEYAFILNRQSEIVKSLRALEQVDEKYMQGGYSQTDAQSGPLANQTATLPAFINLLRDTQQEVNRHNKQGALARIGDVRQSWLSVEGVVVAQSATVYDHAERDMVTVQAMITTGDDANASQLLDKMVSYLTPLAGKSAYSMWDAAMIPIREGLEALLVVTALLAFVKKSGQPRGKLWIWSGVGAGLGVSVVLAVIVKFIFSSGAFGQNNFLISGWTGVVAAALLLYMSYWLHSKSNVSQWNSYIRDTSQTALSTGRLISLGFVSFLAIFREGTETVLFIIGMVNQISLQSLLLGMLVGVGILAVIAYLMLVVGVKLPIRPFFLVSSIIVFYLCFKFTGLGIHSLQLADVLPSTASEQLPSISFLGFYPSWQSAIPQIALVIIALAVIIIKRLHLRGLKRKNEGLQNG